MGHRRSLVTLAERARPATFAADRLVPVLPALVGLLPDGGLRRGSTVAVDPLAGCGLAGTSLAGALVAGASAAGSWCAAVGLPELGLIGLEEMGADLSRLALVPSPGTAFAAAVAALLDSVDLVLVSTRETVRPGDARRLAARARERGTVLVPLESLRPELRLAAPVRPPAREERVAGQPTDGPERGGRRWPGPIDLRLVPLESEWRGLGQGHGHLRGRRVEIEVSGRGAATRPRRGWLWLPSPDGTVREASPVRAVGSQRQLPRLEAAGAG